MKNSTYRSVWVLIACLGLGGHLRAAETVERRAVVPEPDRPHGEVRLVRRDGATIVQTLIHSRSVRRVAGGIAKKERANWPEGSEGADDASRFVEALAEISARVRDGEPGEDRRRSVCIEFPGSGPVTVSVASIERGPEGLKLVETSEPRLELDLAPAYVLRNRTLILADAFGVDEATARAWLETPGTPVAIK